ncbi:hypothetical protein D3C72_1123370 [compost metagenome]
MRSVLARSALAAAPRCFSSVSFSDLRATPRASGLPEASVTFSIFISRKSLNSTVTPSLSAPVPVPFSGALPPTAPSMAKVPRALPCIG